MAEQWEVEAAKTIRLDVATNALANLVGILNGNYQVDVAHAIR